jgi:hypothetical protein
MDIYYRSIARRRTDRLTTLDFLAAGQRLVLVPRAIGVHRQPTVMAEIEPSW